MTNEREEARRKAEVMLAFADGAEIQFYHWTNEDWDDVGHPSWNWDGNDYRVKPKPRECWVKYDGSGCPVRVCISEADVAKDTPRTAGSAYIRMREVTK